MKRIWRSCLFFITAVVLSVCMAQAFSGKAAALDTAPAGAAPRDISSGDGIILPAAFPAGKRPSAVNARSLLLSLPRFFRPMASKASSATVIASAPNPSIWGQAVTFTAAVSPSGATGTVTFHDGPTAFGSVTLSGGTATLTTAALPVGTHPITVQYGGDPYFLPSSNGPLTVSQAPTATALTTSLDPSHYGQMVSFTATVTPSGATGTVTFTDCTSPLATLPLSDGKAVFTTSLPIGAHTLVANYNGDTNYQTSVSPPLNQMVTGIPTTVALTSSLNPSTPGEPVTFTANVTPPGATGTVTFLDGTSSLGTAPLSGGSAQLTTPSLPWGDHSITASYSGDSNYDGSVSNVLTQHVNRVTTTTYLSSADNPSYFGQSVQLRATVQPFMYSGSIEFFDGSVSLGTSFLIDGDALLAVSNLSVGHHTITAVYHGTDYYAPSTSAPVDQIVNKAATSVTLTSDLNPISVGQPVAFTAAVAPASATGTVTFFDGVTPIDTVPLSGGIAQFTTTFPWGDHPITAQYSGDSDYEGSVSNTVVQHVHRLPTSTYLFSYPNPSTYGQTVAFSVSVIPQIGPTGTVELFDGPVSLGTASVNVGFAYFYISSLSGGNHTLTVVYSGNDIFAPSTSAPLDQVVDRVNTSTALTSSQNPSTAGQPVTFTASVTPPEATGTVEFFDGAVSLGSASVSGGVARLTTSSLAVGGHTVTASYGGDINYAPSVSPELHQTVNYGSTYTIRYLDAITGKPVAPDTTGAGHPGDKVTAHAVWATGYFVSGPAAITITLKAGPNTIIFLYLPDLLLLPLLLFPIFPAIALLLFAALHRRQQDES